VSSTQLGSALTLALLTPCTIGVEVALAPEQRAQQSPRINEPTINDAHSVARTPDIRPSNLNIEQAERRIDFLNHSVGAAQARLEGNDEGGLAVKGAGSRIVGDGQVVTATAPGRDLRMRMRMVDIGD